MRVAPAIAKTNRRFGWERIVALSRGHCSAKPVAL
jgi:hypothetical protein